jgi:hypothetical protein
MAGEMIQIQHFTASNTAATPVSFTSGVQKIYITNITNDVYVDFNGRTATTDSFRCIKGVSANGFNFGDGSINSMSVIADTGSADVYIMGVVGGGS